MPRLLVADPDRALNWWWVGGRGRGFAVREDLDANSATRKHACVE